MVVNQRKGGSRNSVLLMGKLLIGICVALGSQCLAAAEASEPSDASEEAPATAPEPGAESSPLQNTAETPTFADAVPSGPASGSVDEGHNVESSSVAPAPEIPVEQIPSDQPVKEPESERRGVQRIDDITVTAEKRVERVQDVPVAVSVIREEQLRAQNITTVDQLARAVPSIEQNGMPGNPSTVTAIRGIATFSFSPTAEQAVSYVVDGVVEGKAPSVNLFDVGRVEVLRGPQGTLFGKNSSAGVINISTNEPDPGKFEIIGHADVGFQYHKLLLQSAINVPVSDDSAFRLSLGGTSETGLLHNPVQDKDSESSVDGARLRFLWNLTPELTLNLIGEYEKLHLTDQSYLLYQQYNDAKTGQPVALPGCHGAIASYSARVACNNDPSEITRSTTGLSVQLDWDIDDFVVTSITAGRRYLENSPIDPDGLPQFYVTNGNSYDNKTLSEELRIATPKGERVEGVAGIYYSQAHVPNRYFQKNGVDLLASLPEYYNIPVAPCAQLSLCLGNLLSQDTSSFFDVKLNSIAVFGQLTFNVTDDWHLIAGLRVTRDVVEMKGESVQQFSSSVLPLGAAPSIPAGSPSLSDTVKNFSWRLGTQYNFDRNMMGYLTASHGYKGPQLIYNSPNDLPINGGPTPASITRIAPEYPMDYEAGLKATILDGLFALDLNLFHNTIKGFQSFNYTVQGAIPDNIPEVVTQGVELDMLGMLAPGLIFNGGMIYNKATYPKGYMTLCGQVSAQCPDTKTLEDVGGRQIAAAPRFKFTLTTGYDHDVSQSMNAFFLTDVVYKTDIHYAPYTDTYDHTGNHAVVGFRTGLRDPEQKWSVALFGRNVFNAYNPAFLYAPYLLSQETAPGIDAVGFDITDESFPFYGISVDVRF